MNRSRSALPRGTSGASVGRSRPVRLAEREVAAAQAAPGLAERGRAAAARAGGLVRRVGDVPRRAQVAPVPVELTSVPRGCSVSCCRLPGTSQRRCLLRRERLPPPSRPGAGTGRAMAGRVPCSQVVPPCELSATLRRPTRVKMRTPWTSRPPPPCAGWPRLAEAVSFLVLLILGSVLKPHHTCPTAVPLGMVHGCCSSSTWCSSRRVAERAKLDLGPCRAVRGAVDLLPTGGFFGDRGSGAGGRRPRPRGRCRPGERGRGSDRRVLGHPARRRRGRRRVRGRRASGWSASPGCRTAPTRCSPRRGRVGRGDGRGAAARSPPSRPGAAGLAGPEGRHPPGVTRRADLEGGHHRAATSAPPRPADTGRAWPLEGAA